MSSNSTNPFVWDRPFAFLWLTSDELNADHQLLNLQVDEIARKTGSTFESLSKSGRSSPSTQSIPFTPHVTLHTTYIEPNDVFGSLERVIANAAKLSASVSSHHSDLKVQLHPPITGTTHFKSVYMDVDQKAEDAMELYNLKESAKSILGPNVPPEQNYLPHLSLWYGTDERQRDQAHKEAVSSSLVSGHHLSLSYLHVVYAPFEDVRSWKIVATSRVGTGVALRRSGFIDGMFEAVRNAEKRTCSDSPVLIPMINPANGLPLAYFEGCEQVEAERAVEAAHKAFKGWSTETPLAQRLVIIRRLIDLIKERKDYLVRMETLDNGKPLKESDADIADVADCFSYYANLAENDVRLNGKGETPIDTGNASLTSVVEYESVGVCVMILPFNYPLLMAAWKVAPALVAGCTIVLKPSEITSATALELAALAHAAGLPAGVLNVLPGLGPSVGPALTSNPLVRKIAFTGSGVTGKSILEKSTSLLPNVSLELGGKSPAIVFGDADLSTAIDWLLIGIFFNSGQVCSATSRLLVHSSVYEQVKQKLLEAAKKLTSRVGDGLDSNTLMGPLVSETQYRRVKKMVTTGISQGAQMIIGERNLEKRPDVSGYYWYPTIFDNVDDKNVLWTDEVFGPVLVMRSFETEEEALEKANETRFGLAAAVFTADTDRQRRVSRALDAGIVWVNCSQPTLVQAPWGGMKESGIGRELGPFGLNNFLEPKQVTSYTISENWGWYKDL